MEFVSSYTPAGESEVFDILNVLEPLLQQANSAVVVAAVKVFLHFTLGMPATHQQVGRGDRARLSRQPPARFPGPCGVQLTMTAWITRYTSSLQVLERIRSPVMTLIGSGAPETAYVLLCHMRLLVERVPVLFAADYKHFYCR